jgi:hypothetical protein
MVTGNLNSGNGYRSYCQEVIFLRNETRALSNTTDLYTDAVCKMPALSEFPVAVRVRIEKMARNPLKHLLQMP